MSYKQIIGPTPQEGTINIEILLRGMRQEGYTTQSAIYDIIDNSIDAGATYISLDYDDNLSFFQITDNGNGMNYDELKNALDLGSTRDYKPYELGKYGLGLKCSALSLGNKFTVFTVKNGMYYKGVLDYDLIKNKQHYVFVIDEMNNAEKELFEDISFGKDKKSKHGTVIKIEQTTKTDSLNKVESFFEGSNSRIGITYYYYLLGFDDSKLGGKKQTPIEIRHRGKKIKPLDILFCDEADKNGELDSRKWMGDTVNRVLKPTEIKLNAEQTPPTCMMELTIVPQNHKDKEDKHIVNRNYRGIYIYRNRRLIKPAQRLASYQNDNLIPSGQDAIVIRGRLHFNASEDDFFKVDVKKSNIEVSNDAYNSICAETRAFVNKITSAFNNVTANEKKSRNAGSSLANDELANESGLSDDLIDIETSTESIDSFLSEECKKTSETNIKRAENTLKSRGEDNPSEADVKNIAEELSHGITSDDTEEIKNQKKKNKIVLDMSLPTNIFYEPQVIHNHTTGKNDVIVHLNNNSEFLRKFYIDVPELQQQLFEKLFYYMSQAEYGTKEKMGRELNDEQRTILEKAFDLYRKNVGKLTNNED